jgi:hypothetical protein
MSVNNISNFVSGFNGGLRTNRFEVSPSCRSLTPTPTTKYHVRAATIPGARILPLYVNWFGRSVPIPGDREYDPWVITIMDDQNNLFDSFKTWHKNTVSMGDDITVNTTAVNGCNWTVKHLKNNDDTPDKTFMLYNAYPVQLGPLNLNMDQPGVIASFNVVMMFTHFTYEYK